jgi:archaemetzincin
MRRAGLSLLVTVMLSACIQSNRPPASETRIAPSPKRTIALMPFGKIEARLLRVLQGSIRDTLDCPVTILESVPHPASAWNKTRNRYRADTLLTFLRNVNLADKGLVLGITNKDISTNNKGEADWGVMGLGYCPGAACVISSYRVLPSSAGEQPFNHRMVMLALHELGHNFGAPHCPVNKCVMRDAKGKMNLDRAAFFCPGCRSTIMTKM